MRYELGEDDFERFRKLVSRVSGIYFDRGKWDLLRLGLADRATATGAESLEDYYQMVTQDPSREAEIRMLLARLAIPETQFFRNMPQFDALRRYVIPELAQRKADYRNLRLWSAGCSTGQEAYSISMSVFDAMPDTRDWNIQVLGTDLNDEALEIARKGWYPENRLSGIDKNSRSRYFCPEDNGFRVAEPVREITSFQRHNIVTEHLPIDTFGTCDVIFCRNVIVYFTHKTAKFVIELFYDILNPGGYLFLGHSEALWKMSAKYSLVEMGDAFIYRKALPRTLAGKRFIRDRRMRKSPLPEGVDKDRRTGKDRRSRRNAEKHFRSTGTWLGASGMDARLFPED